MTSQQRIEGLLAKFPIAAVAAYFGLVLLFAFVIAGTVLDVLQRRDEAMAASETLDRMEARDPARARTASSDIGIPAGTAFLEGPSASVAGAALMQRMAAAMKRVNGNILSSQVDIQGPQSKAGFITATTSFEVEATQLQPLLYDLEAGMPFLFIDELMVQAPSETAQAGKMRVILGMSGQWRSQK